MNKKLSETDIDDLIIAQANDENAWEKPIFINRKRPVSVGSPIKVDKDILNGTPVFEGTRVPVSAFLDNLEAGIALDEFLENFPTVTRGQAIQVLEYFKKTLTDIEKAA